MKKMWSGRTSGETNKLADDFNSSIHFDCRMYREDITGSCAHARMLAGCGIITEDDAQRIVSGLQGILADIDSGELEIDPTAEDIHMFIEEILTERIGDAGKRLHTARSRNDQVALDLRMYLMNEESEIAELVRELIRAIVHVADENKTAIMPGYTHLQRAQPILFAHQLLAYAWMLMRDLDRLGDCRRRTNVSPIGSCALAGTTFATDRRYEAELLGFDSICPNSIDGVSDRDFAIELLSCLSMLMMHMSRMSEELILWSSWEFRFIELDDAFTTGSSIMPQKKNSDMAELIRGKTGRVYGSLMGLLTTLKGLPLAYNKDMQEDKEQVFDAVDTVKMCLKVAAPMVETMKIKPENMYRAGQEGFINATDLADYYTAHGMPFRDAYKKVGQLVAQCHALGQTLEDVVEPEIAEVISLESCVRRRISEGSTGYDSVQRQIEMLRDAVGEANKGE